MVQKEKLVLFAFVIIYLFFLLFLVYNTKLTLYSDDAVYASLARFFLEKKFNLIIHPTWPPLYPILSATVYQITNNWELSLRIVSSISTSLMLIPLFYLAKKTINVIFSVLFIISVIVNYALIKISISPLSDALAGLLIISSFVCIFLTFTNFNKNKNLLFIASFLCGLIFLTRSEGTLFFLIYFSFISLFLGINILLKKLSIKKLWILPLFVFIFLLTTSPYTLPLQHKLGYWTLSQKFNAQIQQEHAFALKNSTTWSQEIASIQNPNYKSVYFKGGTSYILDNFSKFYTWYFQKLDNWEKVYLNIFPSWFFIFALIGLFSIFKKNLFWSILFSIFALLVTITITIFSTAISDIRYLVWTIPLLIFFYYLGFNIINTLLIKNKYFLFLPFLLTIFFPSTLKGEIFNIHNSLIKGFNSINYRIEILETSDWLKNKYPNNKIIMSRHEAFEFYTNKETIYIPQTNLDNLINYAKNKKVDLIIAWERELSGEKELEKLPKESFAHPKLIKVYFKNTEDGPLSIYEIN